MPDRQEPRLLKRKARYDENRRLTHKGTWYIKHGSKHIATGCSFADDKEAAIAKEHATLKLHEYNVVRYAKRIIGKSENVEAEHVKIGDLILYYLQEEGPKISLMAAPKRRAYLNDVDCLTKFWGEKFVSDIIRKNSLAYQEGKKPSVVRNKLIALRAIVNFGASEGLVKKYDGQLNYQIPKPLPPRMHYYSMEELVTFYKAAMRNRHLWHGKASYRVSEHIAKFLLVAVLTGTRAGPIQRASFIKEPGRPWIDLENGIFYRAAAGAFTPLDKRADPIKISGRLLALMKRWHLGSGKKPGCRYLVEYQGRPVDCRKGFYTIKQHVFSKERARELNRHSLKHTAVTILLQNGLKIEEVADYVSTTPEMLKKVYKHVIPGEHSPVHRFLDEKRPPKARPGQSQPPPD